MRSPNNHKRFLLATVTAGSILLNAAFYWLHITTPSDGARLSRSQSPYVPEGVVVEPIAEDASSLQSGDVVTAVNGVSLEKWAGRLFKPGSTELVPDYGNKQVLQYTLIRQGSVQTIDVELAPYPLTSILAKHWGALLFAFISQIVATFIYLRRSHDSAAQVLFLWSWLGSHTYTWSLGLQISDLVGRNGFWLYHAVTPNLWLPYWAAVLHFALIFPRRNEVVRRYPALIPGIYLTAYLSFILPLLAQRPLASNTLEWLSRWSPGEQIAASLYLLLAVIVSIRSYRKSQDPTARVKIRWAIFGAMISGVGGLLLWQVPAFLIEEPIISPNMLGIIALPFPISLAIAIFRHGLFDIDIIINRTLVYSALTGLLALVYFGSVLGLQGIFRMLTGQGSQVAIVFSTLAIAALFNPLRSRIQAFIDRRFYREKYDAEKSLAAFASLARDEVDLTHLTRSLLTVVESTVQPTHISLWFKRVPDQRRIRRNQFDH